MNRRVVWLEAQRFLREKGMLVAWLTVFWLGSGWLAPNMFPGGWLLVMALYVAAFFTWLRSADRAVDDAFLLVRGAVTRRGLTATRWLLDAAMIGAVGALALTADAWRGAGSGGFEAAFNHQAIATGVAFYAVAAVILPSSRVSENRAVLEVIGLFFAIALIAAGAALVAQRVLAIDRGDALLAVSVLTFAAFLSRSLLVPPDFDEPASSERRDVSSTRANSKARSPRVRRPFTAIFFAGMRMILRVSAGSFWMLAGAAMLIGMSVQLLSFKDGTGAAQGLAGFMWLALTSNMASSWLWLGDTGTNTLIARSSALELLLSLPITRRQLYAAQSLAIAANLAVVVAAGLAIGAAMTGATGARFSYNSLAAAAVGLAWSLLTAALEGRVALARSAAVGSRESRKPVRRSLVGMVAFAPFVVLMSGSRNPNILQGARFAIDHAWLITLGLAGLAAGVHVAACRRFEQIELD